MLNKNFKNMKKLSLILNIVAIILAIFSIFLCLICLNIIHEKEQGQIDKIIERKIVTILNEKAKQDSIRIENKKAKEQHGKFRLQTE